MSTGNEYWSKMVCPIVKHTPVQVRKVMQGTLVQEIKKVRAVYRGKGRKVDKGSAMIAASTDEQAVRQFMADYLVPQELIECTVAKFTELLPTMPKIGNGRLYKWNRTDERGVVPVHWTFELQSILALIGALVQCMPEPVQVIRNMTIHGDDGQPSTKPFVLFDFEDDAVEAYTRFVVAVVTPYAVRKISTYERMITGQVYERSLHRTTDMGQAGRRFSDADISDILSRTILAAFFPLYCRTLPLTDKGKAFVMVKDCTLISRTVGEKKYRTRVAVPSLQNFERKMKECIKLYMKGKITEREFIAERDKILSTFTLPKPQKRSSVRTTTKNGYWLKLQCNQTGQLFTMFTSSAQNADKVSSMTGFCGEVDKVIPVDKSEATELDEKTVFAWLPERAFHRSLKGMTRNLYRFLMRRCDHDDLLITEHNESRRLRKNAEHLFSLKEVKDTMDETLTDVQRDVIEAELSLDKVPANVHRNNRKVWLYNRQVEQRTGVNPKLGVRAYKELRAITFHCIAVQLGLVEEPKPEPVHEYTEEELDSVVYRIPSWIRERADRVQLTSFETAFAVQSGIDRRTVYRPQPYFVYDDQAGMMYINRNLNERSLTGGRGHLEPVQLTPVQYPVLSRSMARHVAAVRAISGPVDVENPTCKTVHLDTMTVNGFKVPVWTTEQEAYVQMKPQVNIFTSGEWFHDVYGISVPCGQKVLVDKESPIQPFLRKTTVQVSYVDVFTADGDGI